MLERSITPESAAWCRRLLHDLSQPLTALECRLYLGTMEDRGEDADAPVLRETIREALVECRRLMAQVRAAQDEIVRER